MLTFLLITLFVVVLVVEVTCDFEWKKWGRK